MNQGNTGRFTRDDGVWQDGGLLLHYPATQQWVAVFLAFQSQSWHTDDRTGHTLPDLRAVGAVPGPREPDHVVRIVAALVADGGPAAARETVTLLNTGLRDLDLAGWALLDAREQRMTLPPTRLPAGEAARIPVQPPVRLDTDGGLLTLLDPGRAEGRRRRLHRAPGAPGGPDDRLLTLGTTAAAPNAAQPH